jgi:hypothetical protein
MARALLAAFLILAATAVPGYAQQARAHGFVEGIGGYTAFGDDGLISHVMIGGTARPALGGRIHLGPEVVFMIGPGEDRDLFLTATMTFSLLGGRRAVTPYLLLNGGWMLHSNAFETRGGPAWTFGGGARIRIGERVFVAPEARMGWEPQIRVGMTLGYRF